MERFDRGGELGESSLFGGEANIGLPSPISIIGLGLIGGSLGLALKGKAEVIGYTRRAETLSFALQLGAIGRGTMTLAEAVTGAEVIILATPILTIKEMLAQLAPLLEEGVVVTDTASTKVEVMNRAKEFLPQGVSFIGGHPMAGKEEWGIKAATADLFRGATYCLTPSPQSPPQAIDKVVSIVREIGAIPLFMEAEEHEFLVAGISHLPLILSAALVSITAKNPSWAKMSQLAASGYRDLTRLASGNPGMGGEICLTNKTNISFWLEGFIQELRNFLQYLKEDKMEVVLNQVWEVREGWLKGKGWK